MALSRAEAATLQELHDGLIESQVADTRNLDYYLGLQRVEHLGMAIPPEMRRFMVVANWCRKVVDTIVDRQQMKAIILPGEEQADPILMGIFRASNMSAQMKLFNRDRCVYGRAIFSVASNPDDLASPTLRTESPREMAVLVDPRTDQATAAARFYGVDRRTGQQPLYAVLYLPEVTTYLAWSHGQWVEYHRDGHRFGVVPVIMHLNRRMSGSLAGETQMSDLIPLVDSAARSLTNMQFTQEAHGAPKMWIAGAAREDFRSRSGGTQTSVEAYNNLITMLTNTQAKVGQLTASDLKNYETALTVYGKQAATVTGFPAHYFGLTTANPSSEGALDAEEAAMVRSIESQNEEVGTSVGWLGSLALRFTGKVVPGNQVATTWISPGTPTVAQQTDAVVKLRSQGALSIEGMWDELGWSEARKAKERQNLAKEANDPLMASYLAMVNPNATTSIPAAR